MSMDNIFKIGDKLVLKTAGVTLRQLPKHLLLDAGTTLEKALPEGMGSALNELYYKPERIGRRAYRQATREDNAPEKPVKSDQDFISHLSQKAEQYKQTPPKLDINKVPLSNTGDPSLNSFFVDDQGLTFGNSYYVREPEVFL